MRAADLVLCFPNRTSVCKYPLHQNYLLSVHGAVKRYLTQRLVFDLKLAKVNTIASTIYWFQFNNDDTEVFDVIYLDVMLFMYSDYKFVANFEILSQSINIL